MAGRVVEEGRARDRSLLPGALDRVAVGRDPGGAAAHDRGLQAVLVGLAVVERPELHPHDDHVGRGDPDLVRGVLLGALAGHRAEVRVGDPVVVVANGVLGVGERDPAADRPELQRRRRQERPDGLGCTRGLEQRGQRAQLPAGRVQVVGCCPAGDSLEVAAMGELVGVVDQLTVALAAQGRQRLRRAAGMDVHRPPFRRPGDEVVARAADGADIGRDSLGEDCHVARDATLGRRLVDDRGLGQARLGPRRIEVVDHDGNGMEGRGGGRDQLAGQRRRDHHRAQAGRRRGRSGREIAGRRTNRGAG